MAEFLDVDTQTLHLPPTRWSGADPIKLTRQLSKHGLSTAGMPRLRVHRDKNGLLKVMDGVTRATRVAKWLPGRTIPVEVTNDALQDAGCDNDEILNHCRDTKATHVRGCWVVDLVLGKE